MFNFHDWDNVPKNSQKIENLKNLQKKPMVDTFWPPKTVYCTKITFFGSQHVPNIGFYRCFLRNFHFFYFSKKIRDMVSMTKTEIIFDFVEPNRGQIWNLREFWHFLAETEHKNEKIWYRKKIIRKKIF